MSLNLRLERALARLDAYYEAELKVLQGQSYQIGSRTMTRAHLAEIRTAIRDLEIRVADLKAQAAGRGKRKAFRITPRDL